MAKLNILYPELQRLIQRPGEIEVEGQTVGECLKCLIKDYPGAEQLLLDKQGQLLKQVFVYVNAEGLNKAEMTRGVKTGDTLIIAVLITGG